MSRILVRIDKRTIIHIDEGQDPEEAKRKYLLALAGGSSLVDSGIIEPKQTKFCGRCATEKARSFFGDNHRAKDGKRADCKSCESEKTILRRRSRYEAESLFISYNK